MRLCRHCGNDRVSRPRGLCWTCYYTPGLRQRYPPSKYAGGGIRDCADMKRRLPYPTCALPGTPEKILILAQRASQGFELWHPEDARLDEPIIALQVG